MPKCPEKLGFMKVRAIEVCTKAGIGRKRGIRKHVFMKIFNNTAL
jgi:hypothetical protein